MNFFKNMDEVQTDITRLPAYIDLTEDQKREVNARYNDTYNANQRLGLKIASGIAYEAAKQMCEGSYAAKFQAGENDMVGMTEKCDDSMDTEDNGSKVIQKKNHDVKDASVVAEDELEEVVGSFKGMPEPHEPITPRVKKVNGKYVAIPPSSFHPESETQSEEVDPLIAASMGYISYRATVRGIFESKEDK